MERSYRLLKVSLAYVVLILPTPTRTALYDPLIYQTVIYIKFIYVSIMADVEEPVVDHVEEEVEAEEEEDIDVAADEEEEEEYIVAGGATEIKLFGKWSFDDIEVRDISLVVRINVFIIEKCTTLKLR